MGGFLVFLKFQTEFIFYDERVQKIWQVVTSLYVWTAFVLFLVKLLEDTSFDAGVLTWIVGGPVIVVLIVSSGDSRTELLLMNSNKFKKGEEVEEQIQYFLKLVN